MEGGVARDVANCVWVWGGGKILVKYTWTSTYQLHAVGYQLQHKYMVETTEKVVLTYSMQDMCDGFTEGNMHCVYWEGNMEALQLAVANIACSPVQAMCTWAGGNIIQL